MSSSLNQNIRYPGADLYAFSKQVQLELRQKKSQELVDLYIKFNKIDEDSFVYVISLHEQEYPMKRFFIKGSDQNDKK